ncbi:MAG: hypothetical protein K6E95_00285 [Lachnospiraceae bacterium]|nr:hypothetical protein [Lachnospiraceae bacterium]
MAKKLAIPETEEQNYQSSKIVMISTMCLSHHPENPRKNIGDIAELTESIKKNGIMQNLTVIPATPKEKDYYCDGEAEDYEKDPNNHLYRVLIGNRRMEAAKAAGIKELPCRIVTKISFRKQLGIMLEENMQRTDLTIREQAEGFQLMFDLGETIETIEKKTGFSETTIRHRLNIAKLNKKELDKKEKEFQLSLSDLYALEQIKDVKARNKVLSEATSSENLKRKIEIAVMEEKREANKAVWLEMFKARGITEEPELTSDWGQKYREVKYISLDEKPAKQLKIDGVEKGELLFWCQRYGSLKIATKKKAAKDEKKKLTPEELKRKEEEKKRKQIKELTKLCVKEFHECVIGIVEGKYTTQENESVSVTKVWEAVRANIDNAGENDFYKVLTGKNYWELEEEKRKEIKLKFEYMNTIKQMLILVVGSLEGIDMCSWNGEPKQENLRRMRATENALEPYGFFWPNEELESIALGTSELYSKRAEAADEDADD